MTDENAPRPQGPVGHANGDGANGDGATSTPPILTLYCCIREGMLRGTFRSFEEDLITIGRGPDATFNLAAEDVQVSRGIHCSLELDPTDSERRTWTLKNTRKNPVQYSTPEGEKQLAEGESVQVVIPCTMTIGHGAGGVQIDLFRADDLGGTRTSHLLVRSWGGDDSARAALVKEHLPYILERVRQRMGSGLRARADSLDMAQDAAYRFLRGDAPVLTDDPVRLRAFLARVVENTLRDENDRQTAAKRDRRRDQPNLSQCGVLLDLPQRNQDTPSEVAMKVERGAMIELALQLLEPEDSDIIVLRDFEELSFAEIGARYGITENAARMRHQRALPRLKSVISNLRGGRIDASLG